MPNYIIIESQTTNGTTLLPEPVVKTTFEAAEQEYHRRLMYAAVSSVPLHAVTMLSENGKEIKHEAYTHAVVEGGEKK